MPGRIEKIVVAGDVTIDWLQWLEVADTEIGGDRLNWKLYPGMRMVAREGGALLLARMVAAATKLPVKAPGLQNLADVPPSKVLHSNVRLERFRDGVFRVKDNLGYAGPGNGLRLTVQKDEGEAGLVVLDDAGNGFRDDPGLWPLAITADGMEPLVILKHSRPLASGELWQRLQASRAGNLVVVVSADDLRAQGVQISRRLSWERTAMEFVWQMEANRTPAIQSLAACRHLVVRLGLEGAIYYQNPGSQGQASLFYDPQTVEDGLRDDDVGRMNGLTIAFVAALATKVANQGLKGISTGVRQGLLSARRLLQHGFGKQAPDLDYPGGEIFGPRKKEDPLIGEVNIPSAPAAACANPHYWTILDKMTRKKLEEVAYATVTSGEHPELDKVPVGQFGKLRTLDRAEIESLRSIQNLMGEYLKQEKPPRPLSIAVFGPPGAGKSFAVTEVANSVGAGKIESEGLEFNLSQWRSPDDLIKTLHQARDVVLKGFVPLVFFDEFDAKMDHESLGWLKFFLDPMQSGKFKEGESVHPIGKAIFVFAGGTSGSLKQFSRDGIREDDDEMKKFRGAKGPDFVSRLRGYVDILGVNPVNEDDYLHLIRRAVLLRSLLKKKKADHLPIDPGVLRALLKIPRYKHGARSMEAILEMSLLAGRRNFEPAALPPEAQLDLHVEAGHFCRLLIRDALLGGMRDKLARVIHEKFCKTPEAKKKAPEDPGIQLWDRLEEGYRESNRRQTDNYPDYLKAVNCGFLPVSDRKPRQVRLSQGELEKLAKMEHDSWMSEKSAKGYKLGPKKNDAALTHPCMLPWEELPPDEKKKDRDTVRQIPENLALAGFETYRLK